MNVTIERKKAPDCNTTATAISKGWHHRDDTNTTVGGIPSLNKSTLGSGKVDVFYYGPTATTKLDCTISSSSSNSNSSNSSSSKQLSQQQQQIRQHQQQQHQQQQQHHHHHHHQQHQLQSQQQHHQHQQHHHQQQQQQQQQQQYHQHHSHRHHHNTTISSMDKYDISGYDFQNNDNNNKIIQNVQQVISLQRSTPSSYLKRKLPVKNTTIAAVAAAATTTTSASAASSSLSSTLSSSIASTITTTSTTTITTTSTSSSFCNPSNNSNMSSTIRQHLDFSRGLRTDVTLVPPIRQTASIFKQPVTVFKTQDSKVKNDLKHGIIQDKPKQLFWVKRLEGLRACDLNGSEFNSIDLPKCIKPIGPNINEQTLLQSVATALHVTNQPVTGQNASKTSLLTNSGVFLNPDQPLMQSITINDDDIRRQEDRVNLARRRLQDALKA